MTVVLAIDAGGSHTRAACIDADGRVLGWGRAGGGNATALGQDALRAVEMAARSAIVSSDADAATLTAVLCAAGEAPIERLGQLADQLGMRGAESWHVVGDALGAYFSGSSAPDGIVLIAGTGAIGARVQDAALAQVIDGLGWLIGDAGSGFWIGREAVAAVAAALDGRGAPTSMTGPVLARMSSTSTRWSGVRAPEVAMLLRAVYDAPPTALAEVAPLVFEAAEDGDPVAELIIQQAATHLASTLETVRRGYEELPIVIAGSVLTEGHLGGGGRHSDVLGHALREADVRRATDGIVGAAILALRRQGVEVTESLRETLAEQVELRRA